MREKPEYVVGHKHPCGGYGFAIGLRKSVRIPLNCNRWDCAKCRIKLTKKWMDIINEELLGAILHSVLTRYQGKKLSVRIQRNIKKKNAYFCVRMRNEALVISNAKFKGSKPKNRKKLFKEIRNMMETGKVNGFSHRKNLQKNGPGSAPWSYGVVSEDIEPEYDKCKNEYEIGSLLLKYQGTDKIRRLTNLGKDLITKIQTGQISILNVGASK